MSSLFGRLFVATFLIYPITRALGLLALWLFGVALPFSDPPPFRHLLSFYGGAALAAYQSGGQPALDRFIAAEQEITRAHLEFRPAPPDGCAEQARSPAGGRTFAVPVAASGGEQYCFYFMPLRAPPSRALFEWLTLGLELACCGAVSFLLARFLTRPIRNLQRAATALSDGNLSARAVETAAGRGNEAAALIRTFNRMAERIASLIETQRRFVADVSHEIRSPLARIGLAAALARRAKGEAAEAQFDRVELEIEGASRLVHNLQELASLGGEQALSERSSVDLSDLLSDAIRNVAFERRDRSGAIRFLQAHGRLMVAANAMLLRIALENVLRNALFYTPAETEVMVTLTRACNRALIVIRDYGPGVPESALPHLFEPFFRVDESRARHTGGTGIGLAIVERVVSLHDGTVSARNASPSGLRVMIELPALTGEPDEPELPTDATVAAPSTA
ncbi:MAG TPA: ATP-binding protein [Acetobacteraceae bacterium]|nr:ATP-binding protein [Acetobacteraceae bacterium]